MSIPWHEIEALKKPTTLLKFGRSGDPHFRDFRLSDDYRKLTWYSKKKKERDSEVELHGSSKIPTRLVEGQETQVFKRNGRVDLKHRSLSIIYGKKTLDVACKDAREYRIWVTALRYLVTNGPPPQNKGGGGAAPAPAASRGRRLSLRPSMAAMPSAAEMKSEDAKKYTTKKELMGTMKAANDVYVWGSGSWGQLGIGLERWVPNAGGRAALSRRRKQSERHETIVAHA